MRGQWESSYIKKSYLPNKQAKMFCQILFYQKQLEKLNKTYKAIVEFVKQNKTNKTTPPTTKIRWLDLLNSGESKQSKIISYLVLL